MTATLEDGQIEWELEIDEEGHRTYTIVHRVTVDDPGDGPAVISLLDDLPQPGDTWDFDNDVDDWAFCYPNMKVKRHEALKEGEPVYYYTVEQKFSTKPLSKCTYDLPVGDPLLEPDKYKGSFSKYDIEAQYDRFGVQLLSSSFERIKGESVKFDRNRPGVKIEQNVISLELDLISSMVDTVNDAPLWGLAARCIKLSNISWERKLYGFCNFYFTRELEFEVDYNSWDRWIQDEGDKALHGHWENLNVGTGNLGDWVLDKIGGSFPNPLNPQHFDRVKDRNGENIHVILNGSGVPIDSEEIASSKIKRKPRLTSLGHPFPSTSGTAGYGGVGARFVEYYEESDFLLLGLPASLDAVVLKGGG